MAKRVNKSKNSTIKDAWNETKKLGKKLMDIRLEVGRIGIKLSQYNKQICSIINVDLEPNDFVQPTDFTTKTLYYCFDPMMSYTALFFITTEGGSIAPIQAILMPRADVDLSDDSLELRDKYFLRLQFNPMFTAQHLHQNNMNLLDLVVPWDSAKEHECLMSSEHELLAHLFENPGPATDVSKFENSTFENLFAITHDPKYQKGTNGETAALTEGDKEEQPPSEDWRDDLTKH